VHVPVRHVTSFVGDDDSDLAVIHGASASAGIADDSLILAISTGNTTILEDLRLADGGCDCPRSINTITAIPGGVWTKVRFETHFKTVVITRDDLIAYMGEVVGFSADSLVFELGLRVYSYAAHEALYDDVVCDVSN
jgi:hypothetical protein